MLKELLRNKRVVPTISPFAVSVSNRPKYPSTGSGRTVMHRITQQL